MCIRDRPTAGAGRRATSGATGGAAGGSRVATRRTAARAARASGRRRGRGSSSAPARTGGGGVRRAPARFAALALSLATHVVVQVVREPGRREPHIARHVFQRRALHGTGRAERGQRGRVERLAVAVGVVPREGAAQRRELGSYRLPLGLRLRLCQSCPRHRLDLGRGSCLCRRRRLNIFTNDDALWRPSAKRCLNDTRVRDKWSHV